ERTSLPLTRLVRNCHKLRGLVVSTGCRIPMRRFRWLIGQSMQTARKDQQRLGIPFGTESTAAGRLDPQPVARPKLPLGLRDDGLAVEQIATGGAAGATLRARRSMAPALGDQRVAHRLHRLQLADDP